jgi:hypothetical protein
MVVVDTFPCKEKFPRQNREWKPGRQVSSLMLWPLDQENGLITQDEKSGIQQIRQVKTIY